MEIEKVETKANGIFVQIIATLAIANLTCLSGFIYAWPSYTVANFVSNETVLSHPMSSLEVSLLGSLTNVGGLAVTPFCGYLINNLGRKYSSMLFGIPFVLAWGIIAMTRNVSLVLAAVTFCGVGAAGQAVCSVYISEISQDSIRGGLTSSTVFGFFFGLLFSYILGGYLSYQQVLYIHVALSVIYIVMLIMLKESPVFLIQKGREEEAAKAIAFYRQVDVTSKLVEIEIKKIKLQLDPRINEILQQGENADETWKRLIATKVPDEPVKSQSELKFLWKSESSKRALLAVLIIMALTILMGSIVLQVYAEPLFKEAVPSMPPNLCAIFLAVDFVLASTVCAFVVDKLGRKNLLTSTSALSGVCTALLGSQLQYHWAPHWFTAFLIYLYCFIYTCGAAAVPFVLTAEVFLPEVRGLGNSAAMAMMWIMNFVTMVIFDVLVEYFGLGQCFYFFTIVCFIGAVYSQMCLPETKGLSADAIQLLFLKKVKSRKNSHV